MTEMQKSLALFTGSVNPELAEEIAKNLGTSLGNVKLAKFANGEIYARYQESVRGADVFLIQSVSAGNGYDVNDALMELLIMVDAAKRASARTVSAVVAHYGYARQGPQGGSARAHHGQARRRPSGGLRRRQRHHHRPAPGRHPGLFRSSGEPHDRHAHLRGLLQEQGFRHRKLCVVSPDVGRAKAAKKFSTMLGCDIAIMHKDRPKHNQAEITALIGDVTDKICILNDDMIDTAGSLVAAAATLKAKGAAKVYACATHGLFSGPAYERIANSCIEEVVVTDAVPVPLERQTGKVKVLSVGPLFAKTIMNVYKNGSVASLFE